MEGIGEIISFRKKGNEKCRIPGTKMSYQSVQLLTSTGVSSLDSFLGGGIAVGTLLLVEEDTYDVYAKVLVRYFLAEGITHSHALCLGDTAPEQIMKAIPEAVKPKPPPYVPDKVEDLKIAWRYKNQKATEEHKYIHTFDLTKNLSKETIKEASVLTFNPLTADLLLGARPCFLREPFLSLYKKIKHSVINGHLRTTDKRCSKILRIVIHSLGSPLWFTGNHVDEYALLRFLFMLRSLLRSSYATALITLPKTLVKNNPRFQDKIRQLSDYVVQLESFESKPEVKNTYLKEFDGLFNVVKLPVLNSIAFQIPPLDLGFKLRKKTFVIESLHLPPDVQEPHPTETACSSSSKLDF